MRIERWIYAIPLKMRSLFHRSRVDAELDDELRDHIEHQTEANLSRGMNPEQARRAALIAMGGLEQRKQECRETRGAHWIGDLGQDLTYGWRMMRHHPGFTAATLLILALGIGANTAIFTCDKALLFRHLPYRDPGRLVDIFQKSLSDPTADTMTVAPANFLDWRGATEPFESSAAWQPASLNLSGGDNPERVRAAKVSANLFSVLGVEPMLGRVFQNGEDMPGKGSLVVLSYALWQRRFSGDRNVPGKSIHANNQVYTVIGVMPPGFRFPIAWVSSDVECWTPLVLAPAERSNRKNITLMVIARLRGGVTVPQAEASLSAVARRLAQMYPDADKDWGVNIVREEDAGISGYRELFVLLSLAVGVVLLIACANVANLLLARGIERQNELAMRTALGARRTRLVRQLMTEGILLSLCGGALGLALGWVGIRILASLAPAMELPDLKHMTLNVPILALSLGAALLSGFLFSILPAFTLSGKALHGSLQAAGRTSTGTLRAHRLKTALAIGEVALTLALLLCAGDILNSFFRYMTIPPGFDAANVLTMRMALPKEKYRNPQEWASFFHRAVEEIATTPGVTAAAAGSGAPMDGSGDVLRFHIAGNQAPSGIDEHSILEYLRITPDYFPVTGIQLLRGRNLSSSDSARAPAVAVINQTLARKQFGDADPLGKRVFLDGDVNASATAQTTGPPLEIVGVVRDIKEYGLFQITPQMVYVPIDQDPEPSMSLLVKTTVPPAVVVPGVRAKLARIDPDQPAYSVRSLEEIFRNEHAFFRFNTLLLTSFAVMALVLSLIGIYAVVACGVTQRTREFSIRLALGSPRRSIALLVLRQGVWMSVIGIGFGLLLAWPAIGLLTRSLNQSLFLTLLHTGPLLFPALCLGIALTLLLACLIPARSATRADTMQVLRSE
jgi:putative ABC transport system permease protein